jgi:hypothetical protein
MLLGYSGFIKTVAIRAGFFCRKRTQDRRRLWDGSSFAVGQIPRGLPRLLGGGFAFG